MNEALLGIPEEKRPKINPELMDWYENYYPMWPIAVCCFNNREAIKAEPLFWWYKPVLEENLFFPGVDAHDGDVPKLGTKVVVDHSIILGSDEFEDGVERINLTRSYDYRETLPEEARPFFPTKIIGREFSGVLPNGDFIMPIDKVRGGDFSMNRGEPINLGSFYAQSDT